MSTIEDDLGALIFGEQQALANGLIDGIANRDDAYRLAAEAAGLDEGETWSVERLDTTIDGLLGLLAEAGVGVGVGADPDDRSRAAAGTSSPPTHPLCLGSGSILAYHGDPTRLCVPGS